MLFNVYTIYDSKTKAYSKPFYAINEAVAMRSIVDLLTNGDSDPRRHPEDFHLYEIGIFDDSTGSFTGTIEGTPIHVVKFIDIQLPSTTA